MALSSGLKHLCQCLLCRNRSRPPPGTGCSVSLCYTTGPLAGYLNVFLQMWKQRHTQSKRHPSVTMAMLWLPRWAPDMFFSMEGTKRLDPPSSLREKKKFKP